MPKKGQNPLISHTILIGIGVLLILSVVVTMNTVKSNYDEFVGEEEMDIVCSLIRHAINEMYMPSSYQVQSDTLTGKIVLNLPDRIGDSVYKARFINDSLKIETYGSLKINRTCLIGFNASYSGLTSGGRTKIMWTTLSNGSNRIEMVKI